jgi:hypothetical protein
MACVFQTTNLAYAKIQDYCRFQVNLGEVRQMPRQAFNTWQSRSLVIGVICLGLLLPQAALAQVETSRAEAYFKEAETLCTREGGKLWGVSLCGPMVFADAQTKPIATNQPIPKSGIPPFVGFANAPVQWDGRCWAAYVWSMIPVEDRQARGNLLIHERFHCLQPQLGLMLMGEPNGHLDTLDGRYWLQLEWRALAQALDGPESVRIEALRDALAFRATRRSLFAGAAERERADEIREGLAQYTGTVVANTSREQAIHDAIRQLKTAQVAPSYVRTFAYASGTAYGLLLDTWSPGWTRRLKASDDLGQVLAAAAKLQPLSEDATVAAKRYGGTALRAEEEIRAAKQQLLIDKLRKRFILGQVLLVPRGGQVVMNTTGVTTLPGEGNVYFSYRVTSEWGSLESSGILESSDGKTLRLPAPFHVEGNTLSGDGWHLTLASGWVVKPSQRTGDFQVVRTSP